MHGFIFDNIRNINVFLFGWLRDFLSIFSDYRRLLFVNGKSFASDSFVNIESLSDHKSLMGFAAANIVDTLFYCGVEVCEFISILVSDLPGRMVKVSYVCACNISVLFKELWEGLQEHFLLVLMCRYIVFKTFDSIDD